MTVPRSDHDTEVAHDPDDQAPASRVGRDEGTRPAPLPGTDGMEAQSGGLAGTSR